MSTKLTDGEAKELRSALDAMRNAPVMNFGIGEPTIYDYALRDATELARRIVRDHGMDPKKFGINTADMEIVPT